MFQPHAPCFAKALYNGRDARARARSHRALIYSYRKELTWTRTRSPRPRANRPRASR
nr:MAG TPA: hypothetical protein [Bacteriophage sp.]